MEMDREAILSRIRELCLALPETSERLSHGHPTFFVRDKRAFVMVLDNDAPQCTGAGPGKYMWVGVGWNGMTDEGRKALYAAALPALATRVLVSINNDDATPSCWVNRISLYAP